MDRSNSVLLSYPIEMKPKVRQKVPKPEPVAVPEPVATVNSKSEFFDLWKRGIFGNRLMGWANLDELYASGYRGMFGVRYKDSAGGGGFCKYEVTLDQVESVITDWKSKGAKEELIYFSEDAPDEKLLFQGELMMTTQSYCLFYSREKKKMRDALRSSGTHAYGLEAKCILQSGMTASSYDDIQDLLDAYPNSVIEFSVYEHCLGSCNNRNMIIWEVRNY